MKRLVALTVLAAAATTSCSGGSGSASATVTVFAAASLTESFTTLAHDFEAAHPGMHVRLSFGGSSTLAQQIDAGAPADVFAAASPATMRTVTAKVRTTGPVRTFARNTLVLVVPKANPAKVHSLDDLARPGVALAECAPQVPCGALAQQALTGVSAHPVTQEQDVKAVLTKVELGEVDAGLVYRTDATVAADKVTEIDLPDAPSTAYQLVVLSGSATAREFADYLLSPAGQRVLATAGFQAP